ncbi:protein MAIN-LIKE 1-like [Glycine max]|uniref:protein MAIN-LIKE 1-like n=1 Tax=Glycine max TaxID=3847 RepID=UPI0003DE85D7|nr:protein MAIN-LIKE 1-like [Glycine max]|eukprot:XP_006577572.1 protein MAIN-LIKE 1-like [Glycine max]
MGGRCIKFGRPAPEIEGLVVSTGLSPLIACSVDTGDRGLISAFVERWHRETSSFHLPIGEVSITLNDVVSLLHLPIVGAFYTFEPLHVDEAILILVDLLEVSGEEARAETTQCHRLYTFSMTLVIVEAAWGAASLVHMYDHLNDACMSGGRQLAGYITLLQCWIYENFPLVAECMADLDYDEVSPHACQWIATKATLKSISTSTYRQRLDGLRIPNVCWIPYGEHRPDACHAIAKRLKRLLNLRIVTAGTETHEVMEECIRIAGGVTADDNVYVRSQRRQCTDQP